MKVGFDGSIVLGLGREMISIVGEVVLMLLTKGREFNKPIVEPY
jgi:hypothetical protein